MSVFALLLFVQYAALFIARLRDVASTVLPYAFCHDKLYVRPYLRALFGHVSIDQRSFHAQHWFEAILLKKTCISFFTVVCYSSPMA